MWRFTRSPEVRPSCRRPFFKILLGPRVDEQIYFCLCFFLHPKIEPSKRKSEPRGRPKSPQSSPRPPKSFQNGGPCAARGSFFWFRRTSVFEQRYGGLATFTLFTGSPGRPKTPLRTNVATDRLFCLSGLCKKRPMVSSFSFLLRKCLQMWSPMGEGGRSTNQLFRPFFGRAPKLGPGRVPDGPGTPKVPK